MSYLIAEIGANHQGDIELAKKMVDYLQDTGVKAVKTVKQSMKKEWKKMPYDSPNSFGKTYYDHRKALELKDHEFIELCHYSRSQGFEFIASFTDKESLDFLIESVNPNYYKLPSSRNVDTDLIKYIRTKDIPIMISSGMSDMSLIKSLTNLLNPVTVMQCTSCYPTELDELNLNVIPEISKFAVPGFSGHHIGTVPDMLAYAMGAKYIERHYTFNKEAKGTDHRLSLTASELQELSDKLKLVDIITGSKEKKILDCELPALNKLRKDLL